MINTGTEQKIVIFYYTNIEYKHIYNKCILSIIVVRTYFVYVNKHIFIILHIKYKQTFKQ